MVAREAKVLDLERKLYPLYFEIRVLKRRVEDRNPGGAGECCQEMQTLLEQYRSVEALIQKLKGCGEQAFEKNYMAAERQVKDLVQYVAAQSPWIMMKVADQYSMAYG